MDSTLFILLCYWISNIIVNGSILDPIRGYIKKLWDWPQSLFTLITCFMCISTWVWFIISLVCIYIWVELPIKSDSILFTVFIHWMISSWSVWILHTLQQYLENIIYKS